MCLFGSVTTGGNFRLNQAWTKAIPIKSTPTPERRSHEFWVSRVTLFSTDRCGKASPSGLFGMPVRHSPTVDLSVLLYGSTSSKSADKLFYFAGLPTRRAQLMCSEHSSGNGIFAEHLQLSRS